MAAQTKHALKIADEAARWLVRLREDPSPQSRAALVAWLKHSPYHLEELLLADAMYARLDGLDPERRMDVGKLLAESGAQVVSLQPQDSDAPPERARVAPARWHKGMAAAAALAVVACSLFFLRYQAADADTYVTAVGEQRSLSLDDGSVVHMNTGSRVKVEFSAHARRLRLLEGEALFVVAADPARPFTVDAGTAMVEAVGTSFNIRRMPDTAAVAVIDGRVKVSASTGEQLTTLLGAGEEAKVTAHRIARRATPQGAATTAWRQRQLIFSSHTLAQVVAEVNRYHRVQLRIDDPAIASRRLSGVFNVDDMESLLGFLGREGDIAFDYEQDGKLITLRAGAAAQ